MANKGTHIYGGFFAKLADGGKTIILNEVRKAIDQKTKKPTDKDVEDFIGYYPNMEQAIEQGVIDTLARRIVDGNEKEVKELNQAVAELQKVKAEILAGLKEPVAIGTEPKNAKLKIFYHVPDMPKLEYIDGKSDWIDLRAAKDYDLGMFDFELIDLGISVQLPEGYELILAPRSSTYKNFGIIQANSIGVVDESYCGKNDVLKFPAIALRKTHISKGDRICQFRIIKHQPVIEFDEDFDETAKDRGGIGSTGTK